MNQNIIVDEEVEILSREHLCDVWTLCCCLCMPL